MGGDRRGQRFHLVSLKIWLQDGGAWGYLQVGRPMQDLDQRLVQQGLILLELWPLMVFANGWLGWQLAGLALRPALRSYHSGSASKPWRSGFSVSRVATPQATHQSRCQSKSSRFFV